MSNDLEYEFEDKKEQITAIADFLNKLSEMEDDHRKEVGPDGYSHYAVGETDIDYESPSDEDYKDGLSLISQDAWPTFFEKAIDDGTFQYDRGSSYHTSSGEITRWNEDSYNLHVRDHEGKVNNVEVKDVMIALCEGLTKKDIEAAIKQSYLSYVEQWDDNDIPEYVYGDSGDSDYVSLEVVLDVEEFEKYVNEFLLAMKRGSPNKEGRRVIKEGKNFIVGNDNKLVLKRNPMLQKRVKAYLSNPHPGQAKEDEVKSNYKVVIKDAMKKVLYELTPNQFRQGLKAPLSKSIDQLIQSFNNTMKEKAELIRIRKSI